MEKIFQMADIVSFHVPLNRHTKNTVHSDFLHRFVKNIYLLNLSRGQIVFTQDVISALKKGRLLGFAADVLENENPLQMGVSDRLWYNELMGLPNTVFTPHIAGWTKESYERISAVIANKVCAQMAAITK